MPSQTLRINWPVAVATICGLVLALSVGVMVGQNNYLLLVLVLMILGLLGYVTLLQEHTWQIALLICFIGVVFRPLGFDFGPMELSCGLGALLALTTGWRKTAKAQPAVLTQPGFALLRLLLLCWLVYLGLHMIYNIRAPFLPGEFAMKNALKSYFAAVAPAILLWYFSSHPGLVRVKPNAMRVLAALLLIGVTFNLAITIYSIIVHHNPVDPEVSDAMPALWIPILNVRENPFVLRSLGSTAVLFGTTALCLGRTRLGIARGISMLLIFIGLIGSLLSGGRASVSISVVLALAVLLLTKKVRALFVTFCVSIACLIVINASSGWINRNLPIDIVRPLQWVMISKDVQAESSIESSSRWRQELFRMAIAEWRSNPRIFWFGRATYGFGVTDYLNAEITGAYNAAMEASLRRGATHNLISDLLVTYGLMGCILYYALMLAILRFLWRVYRTSTVALLPRAFSLFCLITYASYLIVSSVGGGLAPPEMTWLLIILIAILHRFGSLPKEDLAGRPQIVRLSPLSTAR
jgi:hypothetical protein